MNGKTFLVIILLLATPCLTLCQQTGNNPEKVIQLVAKSPQDGWWHKTFNSMAGNRHLTSFKSKDHEGKLDWNKEDIQEGKIPITRAMGLAKDWCDNVKPFGDPEWEIDTVTLRFRSNQGEIEYIYIVTLKTEEYKTIDVVILPNDEVIAPELNPKL